MAGRFHHFHRAASQVKDHALLQRKQLFCQGMAVGQLGAVQAVERFICRMQKHRRKLVVGSNVVEVAVAVHHGQGQRGQLLHKGPNV